MQSFHNDPAVKAKYVARVQAHRKSDELIRGTGWDNGKGCAVGCTLEAYDHSRYPVELGIPEWLARLEDTLFEGMSQKRAMMWPENFLAAIPLGVSEDQFEHLVKAPFLVMTLESALSRFDHAKFPQVVSSINGSIALWQRSDLGSPDWQAAADAAWAAAEAAAEAAEAAEAAARAARAAALAADAAMTAWAADAAALAARRAPDKIYDQFADKLLRLLKALPHA